MTKHMADATKQLNARDRAELQVAAGPSSTDNMTMLIIQSDTNRAGLQRVKVLVLPDVLLDGARRKESLIVIPSNLYRISHLPKLAFVHQFCGAKNLWFARRAANLLMTTADGTVESTINETVVTGNG